MIAFPFSDVEKFIDVYREITSRAEEDFNLLAGFTHARHGSGAKLAAMLPCHSGSSKNAGMEFETIRSIGNPVLDTLGPITYTALNEQLDPGVPKLDLYYWKSCFVDEISDDVSQILIEQFLVAPSPKCKLFLEHFHGAAIRPRSKAMAFPHRKRGYSVLIITQWMDEKISEACIAWARETYRQLLQHCKGNVYSNYMEDDEQSRLGNAYGENLPRLQKLKKTTTPKTFFTSIKIFRHQLESGQIQYPSY